MSQPKKAETQKREALVRLLPKPDLMEIYNLTNAQDSERTIIGAILHDGQTYFQVAADLQPGDFGGLQYAMIYRAMQVIAERGDDIDAVMVADELSKPDYKALSGSVTLESLLGMLREPPRTSLLETHVKRIRDTALRVRVAQAGEEIQKKALDKTLSADEVVAATDTLVDAATERSFQRSSDMLSIATALFNAVEDAQARGIPMVVPTGFETLDNEIGGLGKGEVTILAGNPGKGKTTVMLSIVLNALLAGRRVALFSLEMSQAEVCQKLVTMLTAIPPQAFRRANLTDKQMSLFISAIGNIAELPLDIVDDYQQLTPGQFYRRSRQLMSRAEYDLLVIDGLWLMVDDTPTDKRHIEVSRVMKSLVKHVKGMAVPLLMTHQYNQGMDKRADKTPVMYDLSESAAVQHDAHLILGLHRVSYAGEKYEVNQCWILKDRATGKAGGMSTLFFDGDYHRYKGGRRISILEDDSDE